MDDKAPDANARLNIYVTRQLWRRVKLAAAARDLSVSEYCANAIEARLHDQGPPALDPSDRVNAVAEAREFRKAHFGSTTLSVSTAELLSASREELGER